MRIDLPFVGSSREARFGLANPQRLINMHMKREGPKSRNPLGLYRDAGLRAIGAAGSGPCRSNGVEWQDDLYFISGNQLIRWTPALAAQVIAGTLNTSQGRCTLAPGRDHLMIADGTNGYTYDGTTLAAITDPDYYDTATHCAELDSFFLAFDPGTQVYAKSASFDATAWDATERKSAESHGDPLAALVTNESSIYLLGSKTTEVHTNVGAADFPFAPYQGGSLRWGIAAPYSVAESSTGVAFLGRTSDGDASVVLLQGITPLVVSNLDLEYEIGQFDRIDDAEGAIYQQSGQWWYQLTFPTADRTFVLDLRDRENWHERRTYGMGRHRAGGFGYQSGAGVHVVGDMTSGDYYALDFREYEDNGEPIECIRTTPTVTQRGADVTYHEVVLDLEVNDIPVTGQGSDPMIGLRFSDDGARSWSDWIYESMGRTGENRTQVSFRQLGQSAARTFEVRVSDPVNFGLFGAWAEVEVTTR